MAVMSVVMTVQMALRSADSLAGLWVATLVAESADLSVVMMVAS